MIGKELVAAALDRRGSATRPAPTAPTTPLLAATGLGRKGAIAPTDFELHPRRGRRLRRAARIGPHRTGAVALRRRQGRLRHGRVRRPQRSRSTRPPPGSPTASPTRARTAATRGSSPTSRCARTSCSPCRPGAAGCGRCRDAGAERDRRQVHHRTRHPPGQPRDPGAEPLGRQPAEGAARSLAGDRARHPDPRRADPRHRRRRQGRDPGHGGGAERRRGRRRVHLVGDRRGRPAQRPGRHPQGPTARSTRSTSGPTRRPPRWSTSSPARAAA